MRTLVTIFFLFSLVTFTFSQSVKTLTKQFTVETPSTSVDFSEDIIIKVTNGSPRINWSIESNTTSSILETLIKAGRYDLKSEVINGVTVLRMPKLKTKIKLQNVEITEKIKCEILLPDNIHFTKYKEVLN
jgi:hypothetical protein